MVEMNTVHIHWAKVMEVYGQRKFQRAIASYPTAQLNMNDNKSVFI
jgi:hypothetical protein